MSRSTKRNLRERLFNLHSQNLSLIKKFSNINIQPDIDDSFVCPLCFRIFPRASLDVSQILTLEHVPPEAFGGKDAKGILLCGECNHNSGTKLDRQIQIKLETDDFLSAVPGAVVEGRYSIGPNPAFVATIRIPEQNTIQIEGDAKRSNPKEKDKEIEYITSLDGTQELAGKIYFSAGNRHLADIGLLRVAYLMAFRTFGYGLIFHPNMVQVQKQIKDPQAEILPRSWMLTNIDFHQSPLGINVIREPEEFRCFLVVFDLASKLKTTRHIVALPNVGQPGLSIYDWLNQQKVNGRNITFEGTNILEHIDLLTKPNHCFVAHTFWANQSNKTT